MRCAALCRSKDTFCIEQMALKKRSALWLRLRKKFCNFAALLNDKKTANKHNV